MDYELIWWAIAGTIAVISLWLGTRPRKVRLHDSHADDFNKDIWEE